MRRFALLSILLLTASAASAGEIAFDLRPSQVAGNTATVVSGYVLTQGLEGVVCGELSPEIAERIRSRASKREVPLRPIHNAGPRTHATGLRIVVMGTAQLDSFPEARAAFIRAAQAWEALILTPIEVVLEADFGPTAFGEAFSSDQVVGVTLSSQFGLQYSTIRNRLAGRASNAREAALFPLLPATIVQSDIGTSNGLFAAGPVLESLGIATADIPSFENPQIGFNSRFSFDTDRSNGIAPNLVDFESVAIHEIGHALGFTSVVGGRELNPSASTAGTIMDLFRFRPGTTLGTIATAQRILSSGGEHRFFAGLPELALSTGRTNGTGGDQQQAGHFKAASITGNRLGIMDPQIQQGMIHNITANDLLVFDTIGYVLATSGTPQAPTGLGAQPASETAVDLVWADNSTNESGFHIYAALGDQPFNRAGSTGANSTGVRLTGLSGGETFRFSITAFNDAGESAFSEIVSATTPGTPNGSPAAPTNLTATATTPTSIDLRWEDNSSNETGFNVYVAEGNGEFELLGPVGPNAIGGTVTGVVPGSHLRFRITAFNAAGESDPSNIAAIGSPPASRRRPARR